MKVAAPTDDRCLVKIDLRISGQPMQINLEVPSGPTTTPEVLPAVRHLTDTAVAVAEASVSARGDVVSCRKGCGACCRQIVPVSQAEAQDIARLVDRLPAPRRSSVRARFQEARERLDHADLLGRLQNTTAMEPEALGALGMDYFRLGIPCPFLVEESCSIHRDRPLSCREYLVSSPARHCSQPSAETVRQVPVPVRFSTALMRRGDGGSRSQLRWIPLTLALEWADAHPDETPRQTGPEILQDLLQTLSGRGIPVHP